MKLLKIKWILYNYSFEMGVGLPNLGVTFFLRLAGNKITWRPQAQLVGFLVWETLKKNFKRKRIGKMKWSETQIGDLCRRWTRSERTCCFIPIKVINQPSSFLLKEVINQINLEIKKCHLLKLLKLIKFSLSELNQPI